MRQFQKLEHKNLLFYFAYMCHKLPYRLPSRKLLLDLPYHEKHVQYLVSALLYLLGQDR